MNFADVLEIIEDSIAHRVEPVLERLAMVLGKGLEQHSQSLQHTLYAMGDAILNNFENIGEIHLSLPSRHFHLADLAPLGMDNPGKVFVPIDEPYATIEATLKKR